MSDLAKDIRDLAQRRHLPDAHLERWLNLDEANRKAVFEAATTLKLRTGQMAAALDLIEEICVREKTDATALLSRPALRRLFDSAGSAPQRAAQFLDELRAIRYPRLRAMTQRLEKAVAAMRLPREIAVVLPRDLASDELTIQLKVADARGLERVLQVLSEKRSELYSILSAMGGGDEI